VSIEEQRRNALADLRDLLSQGAAPDEAVAEAAEANGLKPEVLAQVGVRLISEQENLISAKQLNDARVDRQRRADRVVQSYRDALVDDPKAEPEAIELSIGIDDFSKDEKSSLFMRTLDAWLDRNL
jgi:hypothetical protein